MKKILFLAANPKNTQRVRLDKEVNAIQEGLKRSKNRERFEITSYWAVGVDDLRRSLLDYEPHIVHFSGHGEGAEGLVLEDESGMANPVGAEPLAELFDLFKGIECVLLNACYSEVQAEAIYRHVEYVIGMGQAIGDKAAIQFAKGFYDGLGAGRSYEEAFKFGRNAVNFQDAVQSLIPVLKCRNQADTTVLVDPEPVSQFVNQAIGLEDPAGQVPLSSPFYVERPPIEADCYQAITRPGALIRIKAARQMGKTSLMTRILDYAKQQGCRAVPIYFQEADSEIFGNLDQFLQWFCATITEALDLPEQGTELWQRGALGSKKKCHNYLQQNLLSEMQSPLVLGLDEVDLIFQHLKIAQDFFALLRAWHERGKNESAWQKLRLVIVHSKEVYIPLDMHQSPFNVGLPIELPEFTLEQVQDLAERHGLQLSQSDLTALIEMTGGHPYLCRVALREIARGRMTLAQFLQVAPTEEGPYNDHLRRHLENLRQNTSLVKALQQVLAGDSPVQIGANEAFQLRSMGLVKLKKNAVVPLCDVYRQYFRVRLREE